MWVCVHCQQPMALWPMAKFAKSAIRSAGASRLLTQQGFQLLDLRKRQVASWVGTI